MLVIVRCSVVSAHCALVTLAVSARGSQVFIRVRLVDHVLCQFGVRSAHDTANLDATYEHPLAVGEKWGSGCIVSLVRHHHCGFPPAPGTTCEATNAPPTSPMRSVAAPRLNLPSSVVSVDHEDPAGCRGGSPTSRRRRRAAPTSEYFSVLRSRS